ncbi:LysR substrate-binding domain-containing protein [Acinetobacter sp. WZC-1]|uniref:LysR substrate-binding domain-containing protein n=1 Tax=Acinetobacter sp. WZC-1 TaxID=3459034 RepID=UPI00403D917E
MHKYHKWLRSFYAVAHKGNFTLAAEYLSIGQPTVSEQVRALEEVFQVELFHRRGSFIEMSLAGRQLYEITRPMFALEDEAVQLLQSFRQRKAGMFRIGAVSPPIAMDLTYRLKQQYPDIELQTTLSSAADILEKLYNFDIDVAILAQPEFPADLYTCLYQRCPIVAVVREDHPWTRQKQITVDQIRNEKLVLRESGSRTRQIVEEDCKKRGIELDCVMRLNSREAIVHAIAHGVGIGFVSLVEYMDTPNTRAITFVEHPFHIEYRLCCLAIRKQRPMIAELFHDCISSAGISQSDLT